MGHLTLPNPAGCLFLIKAKAPPIPANHIQTP
jgi:hypothetical protein